MEIGDEMDSNKMSKMETANYRILVYKTEEPKGAEQSIGKKVTYPPVNHLQPPKVTYVPIDPMVSPKIIYVDLQVKAVISPKVTYLPANTMMCQKIPEMYKCKQCDETFKQENQLNAHEQIHGERIYQCDKCEKSFYCVSNLNKHKLIHTRQKPYTCNICGKAYFYQHFLKKHRFLHSGEKPYVCRHCGRRFRWKRALIEHKKCHTEEIKPEQTNVFSCSECPKTFETLQTLKIHKGIHNRGSRYLPCSVSQKYEHITKDTYTKIHTEENSI